MLKNIHIDILIAVGERGGVENVVNTLATYLTTEGFSVRVIQLVWEGVRWVSDSVEFFPLLKGRGDYSLNEFVTHYSNFLATHGRPDLILATAWPMMTLVARMSLTKINWKCCKVVAWLHAPLDRYVAAGFGGVECMRKADEVFVLNEKTKNIIESCNEACNVTLVRNPVDFARCPFPSREDREERKLLYAGRLSAEKRIDIILYAISLAKETWELILIGNGKEENALRALTRTLHLEKQVFFSGWKDNPWKYTDGVFALVMSSAYEGFPMVALESLACGIPVISTPVDGIVEIIKPGINGYLYPLNDSRGLANILDAISSGKLPALSAEECRKSVEDYEEKKVLRDFTEKLQNVLDKITVIIPCYNVEKQIARCMDSILNQKLHGVGLEIICIDDKSTDNTLQILHQYEERNPDNLLLIPLNENRKQGYARNIGMVYASGNYITFVDADDSIAPEMLQELYEKAVLGNCDIVECAYKEILEGDDLSVEESGSPEYLDMSHSELKKKYILQYGWKTSPWGRLYRRDFLTDHQITFPTDTYMEDICFSERCMLYMNTYIRVPQTYYFYHINPSGVMLGNNLINYYMDTAEVQIQTTEYALEHNLAKDCMEEFAWLHFSKAFAEPVKRMCRDERFFSYNNILYLKTRLFDLFPGILQNTYVTDDCSAEMTLYKSILRTDYCEQDLQRLLCGKSK